MYDNTIILTIPLFSVICQAVHSQNRQIFPDSGDVEKQKLETSNGLSPLAKINMTGKNSIFSENLKKPGLKYLGGTIIYV